MGQHVFAKHIPEVTFSSAGLQPHFYGVAVAATVRRERPTLTLDPLEVDEARWVAPDDVADLRLHPGFSASWPMLRRLLPARDASVGN